MTSIPIAREPVREGVVVLDIRSVGLTDDQFFRLCHDNPELHLELSARKELVMMTLPGGKTGRRNTIICNDLENWAQQDGTGITFVPLTLFLLPNGARRAPDASWLRRDRWDALSDAEQESAPPLCPDFVAELVSPSQKSNLKLLHVKMAEYMANGARLGWLIDPFAKTVEVYRHGGPAERLENPAELQGDPVLPGFVFHVSKIW